MKLLFVTLICLVASVSAREDILRFYHENVGIELAERIKQSEQALDFDGTRIIGGSLANLGAYPHLGGLLIDLQNGRQSVCGSSLLSNTRIVTAAHCWTDGSNNAILFTVVLGSTTLFSGGTRVTTRNVLVHANYNTWNLNNDIAIGVINHVAYSSNIRNVNLPSGSLLSNNFVGTTAQAAGFGLTSDTSAVSPNLRHVNLQVIANSACQWRYLPGIVVTSTLCTDNNQGRSTCRGDSGGPLAITSGGSTVLIGITSFGSASGCLQAPAGFARVTSFVGWIQARL